MSQGWDCAYWAHTRPCVWFQWIRRWHSRSSAHDGASHGSSWLHTHFPSLCVPPCWRRTMTNWVPCRMCGGSGKTIVRTELETGGRMLRCPNCLGKGYLGSVRRRNVERSEKTSRRIDPEPEKPGQRIDPELQRMLERLGLKPDEPSPSPVEPKPRESPSAPTISNPKSSRQSPERQERASRRQQSAEWRIPPRPPTNTREPRGWHLPRPSWTFLLLTVILCAAALIGFLFATEPQLRTELSEWVSRQLNPPAPSETPAPIVVVVKVPTVEPTATLTPHPDSVATIVAMTLLALPTRTPEPSATPPPTAVPTVTPTPMPTPTSYRIDDVEVRMSQDRATISEWHVAITNLNVLPTVPCLSGWR